MIKLRCPPSIKVLEAAGAIADGRVKIEESSKGVVVASVTSSEGDKKYRVVVRKVLDGYAVYSDDNGTRFRKYVGYPILSLLMLLGVLPRDENVEESLKGIPWKRLNETYKKYSLVEEVIFSKIKNKVLVDRIKEYENEVMNQLKRISIYYDPSLAKRK
jgi:hypothetical protein